MTRFVQRVSTALAHNPAYAISHSTLHDTDTFGNVEGLMGSVRIEEGDIRHQSLRSLRLYSDRQAFQPAQRIVESSLRLSGYFDSSHLARKRGKHDLTLESWELLSYTHVNA